MVIKLEKFQKFQKINLKKITYVPKKADFVLI